MLFPQLPADFVASFEPSQSKDDLYYETAIVSAYIEENYEVGTVEAPKSYFKGTLSCRCLVTESQVFFGTEIINKDGEQQSSRYVGLSGSLIHMLNPLFKELRQLEHEVMPELRERIKKAKAQYLHLNSNTATFHSYLTTIPTSEPAVPEDGLKRSVPGVKDFLRGWGLIVAPLILAAASWWLIGAWAIILIVLAIIWAILYGTFYLVVDAIGSGLTLTLPSIECSVKKVIRGMYEQAENYEFLAMTITKGECEGEEILLGTPVYLALSDYKLAERK